jgi:hypothetical protein
VTIILTGRDYSGEGSESAEKRDEFFTLRRLQARAELVSLDGMRLGVGGLPASGYMVSKRALRVEHFFQARYRTMVQVIAGELMRFPSQSLLLASLLGGALLSPAADEAKQRWPEIPKVWDETVLADWVTPLAG